MALLYIRIYKLILARWRVFGPAGSSSSLPYCTLHIALDSHERAHGWPGRPRQRAKMQMVQWTMAHETHTDRQAPPRGSHATLHMLPPC
jgi:hypothetical protein